MNASRRIAIAIAAAAIGSPLPAAADPAWPDTGSWGQAWGDEAPPPPTPTPGPRTQSLPPATGLTLPSPPPVRSAPSRPDRAAAAPATTESYAPSPEMGGWGQAWGDDEPLPAAPPTARTPMPPPLGANPAAFASPPPVASPPVALTRAPPAAEPPSRRIAAENPATAPVTPNEKASPKRKGGPNDNSKSDKERDIEEPVHLTADQIVHDRELSIVTAKGRVEIAQARRTLTADTVSYNLKQDIITASGNVILAERGGDTTFADYFELTGDFKNGVAQEIKVLMADRSRLAAASATRVGGNRTDFDKAVYTPCEPCRDDPQRAPLWQAKAERVTHNQDEQLVEYRDVWMEMGGIPVAYVPYISHPDPTVKRRSGFLMPTVSNNTSLGASVTTPYYFVFNDHEDLTFSPRWIMNNAAATRTTQFGSAEDTGTTTLQHVVIAGEHRWSGYWGESKTIGSMTADQTTGDLRGHVDAQGTFNLNRHWRAGYDIQRQSDDTYSSVYGYRIPMDKPWLTSRAFTEGFGRRDYAVAEAFAFQGVTVEDDDTGRSPLVLPHMALSHISAPDRWGGAWHVDSDALAYTRTNGTSATRLSQQIAWVKPFTSPLGDLYRVTASVRGDAYHGDGLPGTGSAFSGRGVPTMAVNWSFPFINRSRTLPQVVTPLAMVAVSPLGGNSVRIPNEDSTDFELDDTNIFRANRLPGLDRVEGGLRGAYGFRYAAYPYAGGSVTAQIAQGWRAHADTTFSSSSGFTGNFSDYVGNVAVNPTGHLTLFDRVRLDRETLHTQRNEAGFGVGPQTLNAAISYGYLEKSSGDADSVFPRRHYLTLNFVSALTQYWHVDASSTFDLNDGGANLEWLARVIYNDECFAVTTNFHRNYTSDRDYLAGYSVSLMVVFKTLGELPLTAF